MTRQHGEPTEQTLEDELIASVAHRTGLTAEAAREAVTATLRFLTARMPSAWVGELRARLHESSTSEEIDVPSPVVKAPQS